MERRINRLSRLLLLVSVSSIFSISLLFGQADQGAITGTVKDATGGVIQNAKVSLTNEGTQFQLQSVTDQAGGSVAMGNTAIYSGKDVSPKGVVAAAEVSRETKLSFDDFLQ